MHKTEQLSVSRRVEKLFTFILLLYPRQYRKQFSREMSLLFSEMYQEELKEKGFVGVGFWLSQLIDITKSVIEQHKNLMVKVGMKKYF